MRSTLSFIGLVLCVQAAGCSDATDAEPEPVAELGLPLNFTGAVYYDQTTQCETAESVMHCCPNDWFMVGAHLDTNTFKCAQMSFSGPYRRARVLDTSTQRWGMRACPERTLMVGYNQSLDQLLCQGGMAVQFEFVDGNPATQDGFPMHVCGASNHYAMSGIDPGQNRFTCAY